MWAHHFLLRPVFSDIRLLRREENPCFLCRRQLGKQFCFRGAMRGEAGPSRTLASLRVAGAWSGLVEVLLDEWTVKDLRAEVSRRSGFSLQSINLISGGRILKDHVAVGCVNSPTLRDAGLGGNSKLLVTRVGREPANLVNQEKERSERIARIKAAADAMAKRSNEDGFPADEFDIQLENQSGEQLRLNSDDDRRALVMGLMLHAKARNLIQRTQYTEALEILSMAEEAFSLCDRKILEAVDNVALLQLDTVWCLFMLRNIAGLAVARERLSKAREGLSRSHGANLERLRVLQGGFCPELAVYVRLELLEGVVAYHSGHPETARRSLVSAYSKYQQLKVSDEALAQLGAMGFSTLESRRALRVSGQDLQRAVEFMMEEKRKKLEQKEKDSKRRRERREQKKFGKTVGGKAVDITKLNELDSIGYDRRIAAEALRQSENDIQLALDILSNPATFVSLQVSLESSQARRRYKPVDESALAVLISMGFDRERAIQALEGSGSSRHAIDRLLQGDFLQMQDNSGVEVAITAIGQDVNSASSQAPSTELNDFAEGEDTPPVEPESRDEEMEDDIAATLTGDPLAEYDLDVDKEGEAISEYLGLLDSTAVCNL